MRLKLKACRQCKAVVPANVKKCPRCGSTDFGPFEGMLVVFDPERSKLAEMLGVDERGVRAQKVR